MKKLPDDKFLLDQLMSNTLDSIYFKDTDSRFVLLNQACATKLGWASPEEGIGKSDFDVFAKEHAKRAFAAEQQIMATGQALMGVEEQEIWPDGRITWCSSSKLPLRDESGSIIGLFGLTRDTTTRKENQLRAQRYAEQVAAIKEELEEDSRMAGKLQRSFFLSAYPMFPEGADPENSCIEFLHHFNKSTLVSGDYCSIQRIGGNKVAILLCDVLGAGARSALAAALIRGIMQEIQTLADDPSAYLARMNELLYPLLHPDGLLLDVTACYIVLDVSTGQARMASAGHPLPLYFSNGQRVKWLFENLVLRGPALAVDLSARFHTISCRFVPGDMVVLFTDGLFTVENALGEPFCEKRLLGTAQELAGQSLGRIFCGMEEAAIAFSKDEHFTDDVCLVGFHLRKLMEQS